MPKLGRRCERQQYDFLQTKNITTRDAPFGNYNTQRVTYKIVGGKSVPVLEGIVKQDDLRTSRIQALEPIAPKVNHTDPRQFGDHPYADVQPTTMTNRRPDSKDLKLTPYSNLAPIDQNKTRNYISTVFEHEPWVRDNRPPGLSTETEYKKHYDPLADREPRPAKYTPSFHQQPAPAPEVPREDIQNLVETLLPKTVFLPTEPIRCTTDQRTLLYKIVAYELDGRRTSELSDLYMDMSQGDRDLKDFCDISHLQNALSRNKFNLRHDTIRLVAALFVHPYHPGQVNYVDFIKFMEAAMLMKKNDQLYRFGPLYNQQQHVAKLLKQVQAQLQNSNTQLDFPRLHQAFHECDRDKRGTLSMSQIKDIVYHFNIPLQDSLINSILSLCESNNKDEQYRWEEFLKFLNRVSPQNTGLPIPRRDQAPRRDYGMRQESPRRGGEPRREPSPRRDRAYNDRRLDSPPGRRSRNSLSPLRLSPEEPRRRAGVGGGGGAGGDYLNGVRYRERGRDEGGRQNIEERIKELSHQLRDLEEKNAVAKEGLSSHDKPWLDRYLKMANAMYESDISNKGVLRRKDVAEILDMYNRAYSLKLDENRVNQLLYDPKVTDRSGNIMIHPFLVNLQSDRKQM